MEGVQVQSALRINLLRTRSGNLYNVIACSGESSDVTINYHSPLCEISNTGKYDLIRSRLIAEVHRNNLSKSTALVSVTAFNTQRSCFSASRTARAAIEQPGGINYTQSREMSNFDSRVLINRVTKRCH